MLLRDFYTVATADTAADLAAEVAALRAALLEEQQRRTQAEDLAARLEMQASLAELNPNPVLRLTADGRVCYANPAASMLAAELRTRGPSTVRPRLLSAAADALLSGQAQTRELRSNGQDFVLYATLAPEGDCAVLYLTNITAQRAAERELREQQELHELTLHHLPASVSVLDADQRCRYHNTNDSIGPTEPDWRVGHTFGEFCLQFDLPFTLATRRRRLFERAVQLRAAVEWEEQWPARSSGQQPTYWLRSYQPVFDANGHLRLMMSYGPRHHPPPRSRGSHPPQRSRRAGPAGLHQPSARYLCQRHFCARCARPVCVRQCRYARSNGAGRAATSRRAHPR